MKAKTTIIKYNFQNDESNIKSYLTGVKKIYPKRKSDDVTDSKFVGLYKKKKII